MMLIMKEELPEDVALILTFDEETGGQEGASYIINQGYKADFVFAPDGGDNFRLTTKEKGTLWLKVKAKGKAAHGSRTWLGDNAIENLWKKLMAIKELFPEPADKWQPTINIGQISGGSMPNQVPDYAEAIIDIRFTENPGELFEKIEKIADVGVIQWGRVARADDDNNYVIKLKAIMEDVLKAPQKMHFAHGASDLRFFAKMGIHGATFNPRGGGAHTKEEFLEISSIEPFMEILKRFVK